MMMIIIIVFIFCPHCYAKQNMQPVTAHVAWSVCVLDTLVSPVKWVNRSSCRWGRDSWRSQGTMHYVGRIPQGRAILGEKMRPGSNITVAVGTYL